MNTATTIKPQIGFNTEEITFRGKTVKIIPEGILFHFGKINEILDNSNQNDSSNAEIDESLGLRVNKKADSTKYEYTWVKFTGGSPDYQIISTKVIGQSLGTHVKQRNKRLCNRLRKKYKISESKIEDFIEELGIFMENNEEKLFTPEEEEPKSEISRVPEGFDDYPEFIQQKAMEIIEGGKVLETFNTIIARAHEGDKREIELLIYGLLTNRIDDTEQVHIKLGGTTGVGKTHLIKTVLKIVPERFVLVTNSFSPKWLYHTNDLREDYNYILIDDYGDIGDPNNIIGLLKDIMDTTKEVVTHSTIIDGKAVTLIIDGKNIYFLTAAADISNIEIERRCLNLNPSESIRHLNNVKMHVLDEVIASDGSLEIGFKLCQAIFDKLTEKPYKVFNPFIKLIETDILGSTDIKMFAAFVKARTLIHQNEREEINNGTLLGTKEDVEVIQGLWKDIAGLQRYNISKKQIQVLKSLKVYEETHKSNVDLGMHDKFAGSTYREIATKFGVAKSTVRNWIKGSENKYEVNPKPSLADLGFVIVKSSNPDKDNAESWIYLNPEKEKEVKGWKLDNDVDMLTNKRNYVSIEGLLGKISIIRSYLKVNKRIQIHKSSILNHPQIEKLPEQAKTDKEVKYILKTVNEVIRELPDYEDVDDEEMHTAYLDALLSPNVNLPESTGSSSLSESQVSNQTYKGNGQHVQNKIEKDGHKIEIDDDETLSLVSYPFDSPTFDEEYNSVDEALLNTLEYDGDITVGELITDWAGYYGFQINEVKGSIIKLLNKGNIRR
ncbi:helix-turn-helix domain-containing protein [Methanobacterium oryzae]|uniref:helix-turn-helix domain-containing protein n=1 Tax=Methanobacterium oryzae TaxID=69540 RepID=UPI003D1F1D4A